MKEPSAPQVTYDGSLKELAARHVGLVKAVLFALLIATPLSISALYFSENYSKRHIKNNKDYKEYKEAWVGWQKAHHDPDKPFYNYTPPPSPLLDFDDLPGEFVTPLHEYVPTANSDLIIAVARGSGVLLLLLGVLNLLYRFYRLAASLYSHVCLYFTLLLFVPFLNLLVILLLWWAGLRQMRARGLSVGFFGIDPARVD
jgi:hypothetical protein